MKKVVYILLFITSALVAEATVADVRSLSVSEISSVRADSIRPRRRPTAIQREEDALRSPADLKNPENIKTEVYFDETTGTYRLGTKLGDEWLTTPFAMSEKDYRSRMLHESMRRYFKEKNAEAYAEKGKEKFDFTDMQFDLGPAAKIFGPGGVRVKTQGQAELKLGANTRFVDNPSLSERNRKVFGFDFDEKINLNVNGKVGDKVNLDFNYNSEATFNFDAQSLKLRYEGKEDEIIKLVEAGNVSLPAGSSLIRGASSLFGVRTDMQFGRLKLQTVIAQKKSGSESVSTKGGAQLQPFEVKVDAYDENRHFFLAHFFRDTYDSNMSRLPNITSGFTINRIEVWVTNKNGATTNTRNLVGLTDLGENRRISHPQWTPGATVCPANASNSLYAALTGTLVGARDITQTSSILDAAGLTGGVDYEKIETARLLSPSEYRLNAALGYLSLNQALQPDQVLAIAFEYTYRGATYQVGEFSTDRKDNREALFVKTLKNTACTPVMGNWDLMMKNVYSLGATSVQKDKFRLDIKLLSDTTGVYLSYLPEAGLRDKKILSLVGLDRLDNNNRPNPNSYFDFVEGYTIDTRSGRVFFPVVEPFGSHLLKVIGNEEVARRYMFQELYDSTRTVARQIAEKNKFVLTGQYSATRSGEIQLGSMNVPRGSVVVTAGGITLTEGVDYKVDYNSGIVTILNQSILDAGTSVNVSLESDTNYGMQRKTMVGMNWEYDFSKDFKLSGSLMHLGEKPLTTKVAMGSEPLNNTIWGMSVVWKKQSQWLTNLIDRLPMIHCTQPSSINFTADFAQLIAGGNTGAQAGASYIDDFENAKNEIDISNPQDWMLSSVPSTFPESRLNNDVRGGYNRALLAWYYIDPLFTRRSSSITPGHIKGDLKQLSDPDVMEVYKNDLFPNKQINFKESSTLNVLNLAYYPDERGPYNLDPNLTPDGRLTAPAKRWGGMMRRIETSDFETANIEYIEFWMMDPFIKARENGYTVSGDLYFNLGEVSEDILRDGKKFYESGMPADGNPNGYIETAWGRVPSQNAITYAFNTSAGSRAHQDIGLNGLSSENEADFGPYKDYLERVRPIVRPAVYDSLVASPSGDRYHYFRGSDFDAAQTSILDRYKRINNPNGNSVDADHSPEKYSTAYKTTPDAEDINRDYTLSEYEKYFQYRVHIAPEAMSVGQNHIADSRTASVKTRDGRTRDITWYLFRIPIDRYERREGGIADFSSIRFMRVYMTGFERPVVLRLGTFNLVYGEWRGYEQALYTGTSPDVSGTLEVSAVNFEENNEKQPVNYVIPPGVSRVIDPGQEQVLQNNEQAIAMTVKNLAPGDARAIYKNTSLDLRRYRHIQMFVHANALPGIGETTDGETSLFIRLGSDYKNNFYEYEIPLHITPEGRYAASHAGAVAVWPEANMLDIDLNLLTDVKRRRNRQKSLGLTSFAHLYSEYDPSRPANKVSVTGNPTLGEVRTVMIGVRNNSRAMRSVEVWANELRLQQFTNKGGWAAQSTLALQLSDIASVNLSGHIETDGFGGLEESVSQRRDDNLYQYSVTGSIDAGRLVPDAVKLKAPLYYSYSKERTVPRYNPLDTDMLLDEALDAMASERERDSLRNIAEHVVESRNFSVSGLRFDISTKRHPMPYDPANFSFSYAYSSRNTTGETTAWEKDQHWKWNFNYNYSPVYATFEPLKKVINQKNKWLRVFRDLGINYLPQNVTFNSDLTRSYYELQERDVEAEGGNRLPLSWSSDFLWNRSFTLRWDLTRNLHMNFASGTNAEIEQPYTPVNKNLYPDRYTAWRDSVRTGILHLGTPLSYRQTFDASYQIPIQKIPAFDWVTADAKYAATYNWDRGAELSDGSDLGGTISNSRNVSGNLRFKMETLYNHVPFLKKVNRRFASSSTERKDEKVKPFEKEVTLKNDTTVSLRHNLRTKRVRVVAIRRDGSRYPLRYSVTDAGNLVILSRDTAHIKVTVTPRRRIEDAVWYRTLQTATRTAMMVRNVSISYSGRYNTTLPGFLPRVGDIFGQRSDGGLQPGLDFAFGLTGDNYIRRAAERGWLLTADSVITPATTASTEDLQIRATLEPFRDFKIDLSASRTVNRSRSIRYMFDGMPTTETGSFTMTTLSLGSAFESLGSAEAGYPSRSFSRFLSLLPVYRDRVEQQYVGATYPEGTSQAGKPFDPANGTVSPYSADVMIPAFLNAYTSSGAGLDFFPGLSRLLPGWTVTYAGLSKLPAMKRVFKSFNLNHSYKSVYAVGSYSTYTAFMQYMGHLGFITDVTGGEPVPSSPFDISTVSLNETFSPLIGVDMTFLSGLSAKLEYRRTRVLTLSMTSQQITESRSGDFVVGLGYKLTGINLFAPRKTVRGRKTRSASGANSEKKREASQGFSSDLDLRIDFSLRNQSTLSRDIPAAISQATAGNKALQISFSADYALSRYLTLTAYYDRQSNTPLLTASAYPTTTQDFGITLKFILNR